MIQDSLTIDAYQNPVARKSVSAVNELFSRHDNMSDLLKSAARIIAELLGVEECVIYWLGENATLKRKASFRYRLKNSRPAEIETEDGTRPPLRFENGTLVDEDTGDWIFEPLSVDGQLVGYVAIPKIRLNGEASTDGHRHFVSEICRQIGYAIELQKLRQLLASKYALYASNHSNDDTDARQDEFRTQVIESITRPEKVAKIIARSFFKELRKAGFETKQVLIVASEIIENLNATLRRTNQRTRSEGDKD